MAHFTATEPQLSQAEWRAVAIALKDAETLACTSVAAAGPIRRAFQWLTGTAPTTPLADPRLEAIRGFVCDTRRHRRIAQRYVQPLAAQGLNARQIDALALLTL